MHTLSELDVHRFDETIKSKDNATGLAIIVGCPGQKEPLKGVLRDCDRAITTFENLDFAVLLIRAANQKRIRNVIENVSKRIPYPESYKRVVFLFSGHGKQWKIITNDEKELNIMDDIVEPLVNVSKVKSPKLQLIPKLFFIDACRGGEHDPGISVPRLDPSLSDTAAEPNPDRQFIPLRGNYLLAYATMPGAVAVDAISNWTQLLLTELSRQRDIRISLNDILTMVSAELANIRHNVKRDSGAPVPHIQQSMVISTLRELIYL